MSKNVFRNLLEEIQQKYDRILEGKDIKKIGSALSVLRYKKEKIKGRSFDISQEDIEESEEIFVLLKQYEQEIKEVFVSSGQLLTHITGVSPQDLSDGKFKKSYNRANDYETERGDWVFASSEPIDGRNTYMARKAASGMILVYPKANMYVYGEDSMVVDTGEDGNKHVYLKEPNFIYYINPETFTPVVSIINRDGRPSFDFSEEWVSEEEIDITNEAQVPMIRKIEEVTPLLGYNQVFCDVNKKGIGMKIKEAINEAEKTGKENEVYELVKQYIKNGELKYINQEADINAQFAHKLRDKNEKDVYEKD